MFWPNLKWILGHLYPQPLTYFADIYHTSVIIPAAIMYNPRLIVTLISAIQLTKDLFQSALLSFGSSQLCILIHWFHPPFYPMLPHPSVDPSPPPRTTPQSTMIYRPHPETFKGRRWKQDPAAAETRRIRPATVQGLFSLVAASEDTALAQLAVNVVYTGEGTLVVCDLKMPWNVDTDLFWLGHTWK